MLRRQSAGFVVIVGEKMRCFFVSKSPSMKTGSGLPITCLSRIHSAAPKFQAQTGLNASSRDGSWGTISWKSRGVRSSLLKTISAETRSCLPGSYWCPHLRLRHQILHLSAQLAGTGGSIYSISGRCSPNSWSSRISKASWKVRPGLEKPRTD